jgi:hypothetical protein
LLYQHNLTNYFGWLLSKKNKKLNKIFRIVLAKILRKLKFGLSCYNIPLRLLEYFSLTEDKYSFFDEKSFNGKESLFSLCKKKGINIYYNSFTALNFTSHGTDVDRLRMVVKKK